MRTRLLKVATWIAAIALPAVSCAAWLDAFSWVTYQLAQFRLQWAILSALLLLLWLPMKRFRLASLMFLCLTINLFPLIGVYYPAPSTNGDGRPITVLQMNVMSGNTKYDAVRKLITETHPDVLLIEELTDIWQGRLILQ